MEDLHARIPEGAAYFNSSRATAACTWHHSLAELQPGQMAMARPADSKNSEGLRSDWVMRGQIVAFPLYWPAQIRYYSSATDTVTYRSQLFIHQANLLGESIILFLNEQKYVLYFPTFLKG